MLLVPVLPMVLKWLAGDNIKMTVTLIAPIAMDEEIMQLEKVAILELA